MRTALVVLATLVIVHASLFGKKKEDYCKDNEPEFCKEKVPKGFCTSQFHTPEQIKAKCMKSCELCCGDRDPEECQKKKAEIEDFCESKFIEEKKLKAMCGATCNLCNEKPKGPYDDYAIPVSERQPWV
ncbi:shTK domain protein [Cooperia oncophora]